MEMTSEPITIAVDPVTRTWVVSYDVPAVGWFAVEPEQLELLIAFVRQSTTGMP